MATYTCYWPQWACDDAKSLGLEGQLVPVFFGGQNAESNFARFKVAAGDTVVAVTVVDGALLLLASLQVSFKGEASAWLAQHAEHASLRFSRHGGQALGGTARAPLSFARVVPPEVLEAWRFDSGPGGRPLKHLEAGRLTRALSVQGVFRLTEATAAQVEALLGGEVASPPPEDATALEAELRTQPTDRRLAAVLADAWAEQGEPRGELLALELALADAEVAALPALAARAEVLLGRRGLSSVLKQPGGFPFRAMFQARPYVTWRIGWTALSTPARAEAVVAAATPWATPVAASLWTNRRRAERQLALGELRGLEWGNADDVVELRFLLLCPGAEVTLPFQRKPFSGAEHRVLRLTAAGAFSLECALPLIGRPAVLRQVLDEARASLWGFEPASASFTLHTWAGRVARQQPWTP